jgi:hypothetical protein
MSQSNYLCDSDEQFETDAPAIAEHFNSKIPAMSVGTKVRAKGKLTQRFPKLGTVTSLGTGKIPVHVTFEGDSFETDFNESELERVWC